MLLFRQPSYTGHFRILVEMIKNKSYSPFYTISELQDKPQNVKKNCAGSDVRRRRDGLQTITDYKGKASHELPSDRSLSNELNVFYARFEASKTEPCMRASDNCVITLSVAEVRP